MTDYTTDPRNPMLIHAAHAISPAQWLDLAGLWQRVGADEHAASQRPDCTYADMARKSAAMAYRMARYHYDTWATLVR